MFKESDKTIAEAEQAKIYFGTFDKTEIKEAAIEVKKTGDSPIVIVGVSSTCGRTVASYDKRMQKPDIPPNKCQVFD